MIKISKEKPACFERLQKEFGIRWESGIIITYGGVIHCQSGQLAADFLAHELVHVKQQEGIDPDVYLNRFINEPLFRKWAETGAYIVQAAFLEATIINEGDLIARKKRLMSSMLRNYGGIFSEAEAKDILNL